MSVAPTECPLEPPILKRLLSEDLLIYLEDDVAAWLLQPDGKYVRSGGTVDPQVKLLERIVA